MVAHSLHTSAVGKALGFAVLLLSPSVVAADDTMKAPRIAHTVRAISPPTIDGDLSDACYATAPVLTNFVLLNKGTPATEQTEARVVFDDENLYFAIRCHESQMQKTLGQTSGRDANVFADDCVEIFLDSNLDQFTYRQFAVSLSGATWDGAGDAAGISPTVNLQWTAKTARTEDGWTAEVAIPFATLGLTKRATSTFGLNIAREEKPRGELSSWAPAQTKFGVPSQFGRLEGVTANLTPYTMGFVVESSGSAIMGRNNARVIVTNTGDTARSLGLTLKLEPPKELPRSFAPPPRVFKPGESFTFVAPFELMESGKHNLLFTLTDEGTKKIVAVIGREISVAPLAEFNLFSSHYRNDATLRCLLNVTPEKFPQYSLNVQLLEPSGAKSLVTRSVKPLRSATTDVRFDVSPLDAGEYPLKATLIDSAGKPAAEASFSVPRFKRDELTSLVSIRRDNALLVKGKPFFPIGIYEMPATEKALRDAADAGFNLMSAGGGSPAALKAILDRAAAYNVTMWVDLASNMDFSSDAERRKQIVRETIAAVGNHPALLVWQSIDEPAWGGQSADGLIAGYRYVRSLDANHPVWTNHAPRNLISTLAYYNQGTDIAGCDIYPVPEPQQQSDLPNKTIAVVGDETDKSVTTVNRQKPIFMVLQGFGWAELSGGDKSKAIMPTFEQSRFMAYDAIVHGANGVLYWGTAYTRKPSKFFSELKSLVSELRCMSPVFLAQPVSGIKVQSDNGGAQAVARRMGNHLFLIAINTRPSPAHVHLTGLGTQQSMRLLYDQENTESVMASKGEVAFMLEGYGVKIFTTSKTFQATRKDFSREYLQLDTSGAGNEALLHEEGNLIVNPSFEVDANGDSVPDGWSPNAAFSAERSTEVAHSGKTSLLISGEDANFAPLLVQYGVPAQGNHRYVLSAWAKTKDTTCEFRVYAEWVVAGKFYGAIGPWTKGTGDWQQMTVPVTTTPDPQGGLYVVVQMRGKGKVWFDDVALRKANEKP